MRKIFIVQSNPIALRLIREKIQSVFPELNGAVSYHGDFEKTLADVPKEGKLVVITSDQFHDANNVKFTEQEKDGSKLAEEIKKINPAAKVYVFSMYDPRSEHIDGFYKKSWGSANTLEEIVAIFMDLNLDKETVPPETVDKRVIKIEEINEEDLSFICHLLGLTFLRFENQGECLRVHLKNLNGALVIKDNGEIFIWRNNMPEDNINPVNTVPVVLYLQARGLITLETTIYQMMHII